MKLTRSTAGALLLCACMLFAGCSSRSSSAGRASAACTAENEGIKETIEIQAPSADQPLDHLTVRVELSYEQMGIVEDGVDAKELADAFIPDLKTAYASQFGVSEDQIQIEAGDSAVTISVTFNDLAQIQNNLKNLSANDETIDLELVGRLDTLSFSKIRKSLGSKFACD